MQVRQELATVEMPPHAFLGVVVERQLGATLATRPAHALDVAGPHVDPLLGDLQFHRSDRPRLFESQQMAVEFDIAHGASPPDQMEPELEPSLHHPATH